jgi:hypothetical protein
VKARDGKPRRNIVVLVIGIVAGLVAGATIAAASIPDSTGVYTACYATGGAKPGALRLIDPSASASSNASHCLAGEVQISWNSGWRNRGNWNALVTYVKGDVVQQSGSSYVAITSNRRMSPAATPGTWTLLASRGAQGPSGIVGTATFNGLTNSTFIPNSWQWGGPTATVTITATQRLTGSAAAVLGASQTPSNSTFEYGLCYRLGNGAITSFDPSTFAPFGHIRVAATDSFPTDESVVPGTAGTYTVGFCIDPSGFPFNPNAGSSVEGWITATN